MVKNLQQNAHNPLITPLPINLAHKNGQAKTQGETPKNVADRRFLPKPLLFPDKQHQHPYIQLGEHSKIVDG